MEELSIANIEPVKPKATRIEDIPPEHKAFARGVLNVAEVTSLEEARNANWKFDGKYRADSRSPESTNYTVIEKESSEKEIVHDMGRKCTICHQPNIKNVALVSVNSQVVQMGRDCASKLMRFVDTGEIIAESSIKKIYGDQVDIFVDVLDNEDGVEKTERKKRRTVASMMSWLNDHANDEETPEDIRYAIETYNNVGMMLNNDVAKKAAEYYKANRKFLPDEILDDNYLTSFKRHIHARLLRGVAQNGLVQNDVEQLKRIINKGKELAKKRVERRLGALEKERMEHEIERQRIRAATVQKIEEAKKALEKEEWLKELDLIHLETFFTKGLIEKGEFNQREFKIQSVKNVRVLKDKHGRYTIEGHQEGLKGRANSFYELEIGSDNTRALKVYALDQVVRATGPDEKYFVIVDMVEEFVPKAHDPSKIDKINSALNLGQFNDYPVSVVESAIEKARVDIKFVRYSCAEVVVDRSNKRLVVKMSAGDVPLEDMIEQGKIIFTDDDGFDGNE